MTSDQTAAEPQTGSAEETVEARGTLSARLEAFESFVARRFDELSAEVNATSLQLNMAEAGLSERFSEVFDVIETITRRGDGSEPAHAGIELDAVVDRTEEAAVRILDAASRIEDNLERLLGTPPGDETTRRVLQSMKEDVGQITVACTFQDLTGQRIRNTLSRLRQIETTLHDAAGTLGLTLTRPSARPETAQPTGDTEVSQADIDALFA